ncbi:MAG: GNAT family N-acetyltransferase [Anaerolineae bacterium]|nr:GNAT family N-acetyltransferase [Anaerolineae bacterium]
MFATAALNLQVRVARHSDIPALNQLIRQSVRGLLSEDYTPQQIESSLVHLFGVDTHLIDDGTYYVAEVEGCLAGAGGWSRRAAIYGHDSTPGHEAAATLLNPLTDAARIRAYFVHPDFARRGIARELLYLSEAAARAEGFWKLELVATWKGAPVYRACGFEATGEASVKLPDGVTLTGLYMRKILY